MSGRWLANLVLATAAIMLALAVRQTLVQEVRESRITPLATQAIEQVVLERQGGVSIRLERDRGIWWMREPIAAPADPDAVAQLLAVAEARSERALPASSDDRKRLGLQPPRIRLALDGLTLSIGDAEPINGQRYVAVGELVHLIDPRHLRWLLAEPQQLLSRRLLPPGFSPGLGAIDGRPLSADALAGLADIEATQVEPLDGELSGRLLRIESADGDEAVRFLISAGGTRWSRLDQRLTFSFESPPLVEPDEDTAAHRVAPPNRGLPQPVPGTQGR